MTPNIFATLALWAWPVVVWALYSVKPVGRATIWAILGGYLLLPVGTGIKFAGIPEFDKATVPNLAALIGSVFIAGRPFRVGRGFGLPEILLLVLLTSPFVTSMLNGDTIITGGGRVVLPGVGSYDALSAVVSQFLFILPFFLGRNLLHGPEDTADILRALITAGLIYSLPMLFEIRMSPQLHAWVYGYSPGDFLQQIREGGFRPVVFLGHGLLVAFFTSTTVVAASAFWRLREPIGSLPVPGVTAYLSGMLILCKSAGALIYAGVLMVLVRFTRPGLQMNIARALVAIAMLYPVLRATNVFPTHSLLEIAHAFSEEREQSLRVRFDNEDVLLAHAWQRLPFGWGRFGRNRVYSDSGKDDSITDGAWVIIFGVFGLVGFLAQFGLLAVAVVRAASAVKWAETQEDQIFLAALTLIVTINIVDLLPNSSLSPWTWLLAGACLGRSEAIVEEARRPFTPHPDDELLVVDESTVA